MYDPSFPLEASYGNPTYRSANQSSSEPGLLELRAIKSDPDAQLHPAAKALIWDTEEKFCHAFWRNPREKKSLQFFTSSFVSVLRASWTLIDFTVSTSFIPVPVCKCDFVKW